MPNCEDRSSGHPRHDAAGRAQDEPVPAPGLILVIDDDEPFRLLVRRLLEQAGYRVLEATNSSDGLRLAAQLPVTVLITYIVMPDCDGIETIRQVRVLHPKVKILAISGMNAQFRYLQIASRLGAHATLEKVLVPAQLVETIRAFAG